MPDAGVQENHNMDESLLETSLAFQYLFDSIISGVYYLIYPHKITFAFAGLVSFGIGLRARDSGNEGIGSVLMTGGSMLFLVVVICELWMRQYH